MLKLSKGHGIGDLQHFYFYYEKRGLLPVFFTGILRFRVAEWWMGVLKLLWFLFDGLSVNS